MKINEFITERLGPHNYQEANMLIAGTKPAGIALTREDMKKLAPYIKSGQLIARREFRINGWSDNIGGWIVGQANNQAGVDALYELLKAKEIRNDEIGWDAASKLPNTEYHTKLGRLLGYSEDDINFAHNKWEKMRQAKRDAVKESLNINEIREDPYVRMWYHGTSQVSAARIIKSGFMKPQFADFDAFGKAIFFTSSRQEAMEDYGDVLCCLPSENLKKLRFVRSADAEIQVKEKIPIQDLKILGIKKPVSIGGIKYPAVLPSVKEVVDFVESVSSLKISRGQISAYMNDGGYAELTLMPIKKLFVSEEDVIHNIGKKQLKVPNPYAPLLVQDFGNSYVILDGIYRFKQALKNGAKEIWCYVCKEDSER